MSRNADGAPAQSLATRDAAPGPSGDELAQAVAQVWSEVLGVHPVGVEDDFFSLGGDSMLAAEAAAAVRERLGLAASLRLVFEAPRPCDFAAVLAPHPVRGAAQSDAAQPDAVGSGTAREGAR